MNQMTFMYEKGYFQLKVSVRSSTEIGLVQIIEGRRCMNYNSYTQSEYLAHFNNPKKLFSRIIS